MIPRNHEQVAVAKELKLLKKSHLKHISMRRIMTSAYVDAEDVTYNKFVLDQFRFARRRRIMLKRLHSLVLGMTRELMQSSAPGGARHERSKELFARASAIIL